MTQNTITSVLFCSRNKDNKHLENFKEHRVSFVTTKSDEELKEGFKDFVAKGRDGEFCRLYRSVNKCDNKVVQKQLLHALIDNDYNMASIPQRIASLADKPSSKAESKWLFDVDPETDTDLEQLLENFLKDVQQAYASSKTKKAEKPKLIIETHKTPNGYAVIVNHGFDTRKLLAKYPNVELKRDDKLCINWSQK